MNTLYDVDISEWFAVKRAADRSGLSIKEVAFMLEAEDLAIAKHAAKVASLETTLSRVYRILKEDLDK